MNPSFDTYRSIIPVELDYESAMRKFAPKTKTRLSESFQPLDDSVIIGKGKMPAQATGNKRLRVMVDSYLEEYSNAKYKREKTYIVTEILNKVQQKCPEGAFVKFDEGWWEVSDRVSREKIACMFRDSLSSQYKSSNKNKVAKRRAQRALKRSGQTSLPTRPLLQVENFQQFEQEKTNFDISSTKLPPALPRSSLFVLEGLDLGEILDTIDKNVFDDPLFFGDDVTKI